MRRLCNPIRTLCLLLILMSAPFLVCSSATGFDDPFSSLFASRKHDFGTVARGSRTIHDFTFRNPFKQAIVIADARSSCGCTRASVPRKIIQPGEEGKIRAEYNTRSFLGSKSATITVVLVEPVSREIQLRVTGNIRGDVVLEPGELTIQNIRQGESKTVETQIHYAGNPSWQVVDVRSSLGCLVADLEEVERRQGSVKYRLKVTMQGNFPAGQIRDSLTLVTNDRKQKELPLPFAARVHSPLSVSPGQLEIGKTETTQKRLVLKSDQPFRISKVDTDDKRIEVSYRKDVRKTQLITLAFKPLHGIPVAEEVPVRIETDLGSGFVQTVIVRFIE